LSICGYPNLVGLKFTWDLTVADGDLPDRHLSRIYQKSMSVRNAFDCFVDGLRLISMGFCKVNN